MKPRPIKIPSVLCCIGQVLEVAGDFETYKFPVKDRVLLYASVNGKQLFCLKPDYKRDREAFENAVKKRAGQVDRAMNLYERWHDFDAVSGSLLSAPRGFLHDCGRALHIIYSSDKWIAKPRKYIHEFKHPPKIWANKKTEPTVLVLNGGKIRITKEGITG